LVKSGANKFLEGIPVSVFNSPTKPDVRINNTLPLFPRRLQYNRDIFEIILKAEEAGRYM